MGLAARLRAQRWHGQPAHRLGRHEIDENLIRRTFDDATTAYMIAERKRLYEQLHPEVRHGAIGNGRRKSLQIDNSTLSQQRFTAATAKVTGKSEASIQRAARRGSVLGPDALRVAGTSLAKGVELDDLRSELVTIDESLERRHLSDAERAHFVGRRKEIYEALHPETRNGAVGNGREKLRQIGEPTTADRFTASTAKASGRSERDVQRDAERAKRIGDE